MKKYVIILAIVFGFLSCGSLRLVSKCAIEDMDNLKRFNLKDFNNYAFNICEKYTVKKTAARFCDCPEDFYEVAKRDSMIKVEEIYLLKHRKTNLVLYLTTVSHKYIRKDGTGFLNDSTFYKNNIVLDQIESVYVGRYNKQSHLVHFPSFKDFKDIILHFDPTTDSSQLKLMAANIATAENGYDISDPIDLEHVFDSIVYKRQDSLKITYYRGASDMAEADFKSVDRIFLTALKGEVQVNFGFKDFNKYYQMRKKRVKYHPNFFLIQEH